MDGSDKYIGRILDNRYEILELIGTGGMALVYKARCHRLNRMVAIKILKEDLAEDEEFQRRFYTESQAVAMLSHPNIVAVYDVSRSGKTEYIVMELIEGITLKQYINRKGLLNWKEALHFATQITKALSHAHSRGIIHRDIKPHNIMILKDGSVKVADFGIARLLSVTNTLTQEALGSVHYISPEQAKGGHVDARSDIYSVGVVMYEMLTSRLPFVGDSPVSVAIQHISAIPLMPRDINPDIPVGLEDITMHAMEPDLQQRFTSAEEMLSDLEEFRKNPAIMFNYAVSDPGERKHINNEDFGETRIIPKEPSAKSESAVAKPEGAAAKPETGLSKTETGLAKSERFFPVKRRTRAIAKPDMSADEYRSVRTRASSTSILVGIFCIIAFLIAIVIFMWQYLLKDIFSPQERDQVTIPSFINRRYSDIIGNEEYTETYTFSQREEYSDDFARGLVIHQNPAAERVVSVPLQGRKIAVELVVSLGGAPPLMMPDLRDKLWSVARNELISLGLGLEIDTLEIASDITPGMVIETIPAAGEMIARGYTVTIRYSGGPDIVMVTVPELLLPTTEAALRSAFRGVDLDLDIERYASLEYDEGVVTYISNSGKQVPAGTRIVVHISTGPPHVETTEPPDETPEPPDETPEPPDETPEPTPPTEPPDETDPPVTDSPETNVNPNPDSSSSDGGSG